MSQPSQAITYGSKLDRFFGVSAQVIATVFLARFITDTGVRSLFPFISQFSEGLGLTIVGFGALISLRAAVGILGPIFGIMADRYGRRAVMTGSLVSLSVGSLGLAVSWQWWAILPMIFFGFASAAFVPAGHAYISDQVPYEKRGRALATVEFSWALASIIALPLLGWLIDAVGWRSPFIAISLFSLIGAVMIWFRLPATQATADESSDHTDLSWSAIARLCLQPKVLAIMGTALCLSLSVSMFFTLWGVWLSSDFAMDAVMLGFVATSIGVAELGGSGVSSLFIDRMGKRRGSMLGLLLAAILFLLLPVARSMLPLVIVRLAILGLLLEFTIVSLIPLYSVQVPEARATIFSFVNLGMSAGFALGSWVAASLWDYSGLWSICIVAATASIISLALVWQFLQEENAL